jgi:hypothetical protein
VRYGCYAAKKLRLAVINDFGSAICPLINANSWSILYLFSEIEAFISFCPSMIFFTSFCRRSKSGCGYGGVLSIVVEAVVALSGVSDFALCDVLSVCVGFDEQARGDVIREVLDCIPWIWEIKS